MSNLANIYIAFSMNMFLVNCWLVLQIVSEMFSSISWKSDCIDPWVYLRMKCSFQEKMEKN